VIDNYLQKVYSFLVGALFPDKRHAQYDEDVGLERADQDIEIEVRDVRQHEPHDEGQHIINHPADDDARKHVPEKAESHRQRLRQFTDKVYRQEERYRFNIGFQIPALLLGYPQTVDKEEGNQR
jgi:hypothetical protein